MAETNSLTTQQVLARAAMCYRERKCFISLEIIPDGQVGHAFHPDAGTNVLVDVRFVPKEKEG